MNNEFLMISVTGENRIVTVDEFEHKYHIDALDLMKAVDTGELLYDENGNAFYVDLPLD